MNGLDLLLGFFLAIFVVRGFRRGLLREGFGLAGLISGVAVAIRYHSLLAKALEFYFSRPGFFWGILAFVLLFLICVSVFSVLGYALNRLVRIAFLSFWDSLGGLVFGLFKGAMVLGLVILIAQRYLPERLVNRQKDVSVLAKPLTHVARLFIQTVEGAQKLSTPNKDPGSNA